jgi:glycosyl transferase, family 25
MASATLYGEQTAISIVARAMKSFIINIKKAQTRREHMARVMAQTGIAFEFFPAVTPADEPLRYFAGLDNWTFLLETGRNAPRDGEIGCYASHLLLWKKCLELNEPIIVLEDDVEPTVDFATVYAALRPLVLQFGFIRLDTPMPQPNYFSRNIPADATPVRILQTATLQLFHPTYVSLGTGAYAISPAAAARLIRASRKLCCPVDNFLRRTWKHQQPIVYIDPLPFQLAGSSSVSQLSDRANDRPYSRLIRKLRRLPKHPYRVWARHASRRESARVRTLLRLDTNAD